MPPVVIAGAIAGAGSLGGAAIASSGANHAANTQANAELTAAQLQKQQADDALAFNEGVYGNSQAEIAPFLNEGYGALSNLQYLAGIPFNTPGGGGGGGGGNPLFTAGNATASVPADPLAKYQGQSFSELVNSGDPSISPNQQTTNMWRSAGIPFTNITTSDGRQVAVKANPQASLPASVTNPASSGINIPSDPSKLVNPNLGTFGSLLQPFVAPTNVTEQNDPGYQFRLQQGQDAINNSAAARGGLLSGGTAKALNDWTQNQASNEYGNVYNRAFNTFETNQANTWNRLAALAGIGQQAVGTSTQQGQNAAGNTTNIDLTAGQQIGSDIGAAGSARASGYLNSGNIWGNAVSNSTGSLLNLALLAKMFPGGGGGDAYSTYQLPGGGTNFGAIDMSGLG